MPNNVPSVRSVNVDTSCCESVVVTVRQFDAVPIRVGTQRVVVLPSPSRPSMFHPHAHNVPLVCTPNESRLRPS